GVWPPFRSAAQSLRHARTDQAFSTIENALAAGHSFSESVFCLKTSKWDDYMESVRAGLSVMISEVAASLALSSTAAMSMRNAIQIGFTSMLQGFDDRTKR